MAEHGVRFEMRVPAGLLVAVDGVRGGVSRAEWIRGAVERALAAGSGEVSGGSVGGPVSSGSRAGSSPVRSAPPRAPLAPVHPRVVGSPGLDRFK